MAEPATSDYETDASAVFKAVCRAAVELNYTIISANESAGLLTYNYPKLNVSGSALIESLDPQKSRLTVSGSVGMSGSTMVLGVLNPAAGFGVGLVQIGAGGRAAAALVNTSDMILGKTPRPSSVLGGSPLQMHRTGPKPNWPAIFVLFGLVVAAVIYLSLHPNF